MKNQVHLIAALLMLSGPSMVLAEGDAKELFTALCSSCHVTSGQPTLAPPIFGVINHVKSAHPTKEEFVERIVSWVEDPQEEKSLMPGAIRRFGLMPKPAYKTEDVRAIAGYLFDGEIELPQWYKEHYEQEHGHEPG